MYRGMIGGEGLHFPLGLLKVAFLSSPPLLVHCFGASAICVTMPCFVSQVFQNSVFGHDTGFHPTDVAFDPLISELQRAAQ